MRAFQKKLLISRKAWVPPGAHAAIDWKANRSQGRPTLACTRTGRGAAVDRSGAFNDFAADTMRRTNMGVRLDPATVNLIQNPRGIGGGFGLFPIGWSSATLSGVTPSCEGPAIVDGFPCTLIRISGTTSGVANNLQIFFNTTTMGSALSGDTVLSAYRVKLMEGDMTGLQGFKFALREHSGSIVNFTPATSHVFDSTGRWYVDRQPYVLTQNCFVRPNLFCPVSTTAGQTVNILLAVFPVAAKNVASFLVPVTNDDFTPTTANLLRDGPLPAVTFISADVDLAMTVTTGVTYQGYTGQTIRIFGTSDASPSTHTATWDSLAGTTAACVATDYLRSEAYMALYAGSTANITSLLMSWRGVTTGNVVTNTLNSNAVAPDSTVRKKTGFFTATGATTVKCVVGVNLIPVLNSAVDITLFVATDTDHKPTLYKGSDTTTAVATLNAGTVTAQTVGDIGTKGSWRFDFYPGEGAAYEILRIASQSGATNYLAILQVLATDKVVARRVVSGVADADVTIATGRLSRDMLSRLVIAAGATGVNISLNGRTAVALGAALPFSDGALVTLGRIMGEGSLNASWNKTLSAAQAQARSRVGKNMTIVIVRSQSLDAGTHGHVTTTYLTTVNDLPSKWASVPAGRPRAFMFLVDNVALSADPVPPSAADYNSFKRASDIRMGSARLDGNEQATDMTVSSAYLLAFTPVLSRQGPGGSTHAMTPTEVVCRKLADALGENNVTLGFTDSVGGASVRSMVKVPGASTLPNGVVPYADLETAMTRAKAIADLQGLTINRVVYCHSGHPQDDDQASSVTTIAKLDLKTTIAASALSIFGHATENIFINTMHGVHDGSHTGSVLGDASLADTDYNLACPEYFMSRLAGLDGQYGDKQHRSARGQELIGQRIAKAALAVIRGESWSGAVSVTGAVRVGNVVTLSTTGAKTLPLQINTTDVIAKAQSGFKVFKVSDSSDVPSTISVSGSSIIVTATNGSINEPLRIEGGLDGYQTAYPYTQSEQARMNICDSSADLFDDGSPDYQWLRAFTITTS